MKLVLAKLLSAIGVVAAICLLVLFQGGASATVRGATVLCEQQGCLTTRPLPNAKVIFKLPSGVQAYATRSDDAGRFSLNIQPGHYTIWCEYSIPPYDGQPAETRQVGFEFGPKELWVKPGERYDVRLGFTDLRQS